MAKKKTNSLIPAARIEKTILVLRGQKVILDADLASLYGVTTKQLNQQVKRNQERFPADFVFRITKKEKEEVVTNCDHLQNLKFSPTLPYAFTEHGALMAANVLKTALAIEMSVEIVRTFIRLREMLATHKELARKLEELEKKYDTQFQVVFEAIRQLMGPPPAEKKGRIGFQIPQE